MPRAALAGDRPRGIPAARNLAQRLAREDVDVPLLDECRLALAHGDTVRLEPERAAAPDPPPLLGGLHRRGTLPGGLALDLALRHRTQNARDEAPAVSRGINTVGGSDDRDIGVLAAFQHAFQLGEAAQQPVHVPADNDVELAGVDAGHHRRKLRARFATQCRNVVVDELGDDGPAA